VGVLIYRLISLWLVLLTGWVLFFLIDSGGADSGGQGGSSCEPGILRPPPATTLHVTCKTILRR
jgi:hypothetical protein